MCIEFDLLIGEILEFCIQGVLRILKYAFAAQRIGQLCIEAPGNTVAAGKKRTDIGEIVFKRGAKFFIVDLKRAIVGGGNADARQRTEVGGRTGYCVG